MLRIAALVVSAALLLAGCAGSRPTGTDSASQRPTSSSSSSPSVVAPSSSSPPSDSATSARPAPPRAGACYRLDASGLTSSSSSAPSVPCSAEHTAVTVYVGHLSAVSDRRSPPPVDAPTRDASAVQRHLATTCPAKLAAYVRGSRSTRDLSRLAVVWFTPDAGQLRRGADWFRCDLVAFSGQRSLYPLPRHGSLRGVLSRDGALDTYGLCGSTAPGARGFSRVICAREHAWRAYSTVALPGTAGYPGVDIVTKAGQGVCRARAKERANGALSFRYGYEWPTREQWADGQHYGYCWGPA